MEWINIGFTCAFFVEMVLRILGVGFRGYARDRFNLFDAFLVIVGIIEIILNQGLQISSGLGAITVFRSFRLFRIFKLARSWTSLKRLLSVLISALSDIKNFSVLVLLFMIISALLGMELFAYRAKLETGDYPRMNFNTFYIIFNVF